MPPSRGERGIRLDLGGMALVSAAAALVYPLVQGRELGWRPGRSC
jgi:hypothetical protein